MIHSSCFFLYGSVLKALHLWTQYVYRLRSKQSSFTYLCVVYWMVPSVIWITCGLMGLLVNWKGYRRKLWFSWRYCSSTCLWKDWRKLWQMIATRITSIWTWAVPNMKQGWGQVTYKWYLIHQCFYNMVTSVNFSMFLYFITFWREIRILLSEFWHRIGIWNKLLM